MVYKQDAEVLIAVGGAFLMYLGREIWRLFNVMVSGASLRNVYGV